MNLVSAEPDTIEEIVEMSIRAFESDINVGGEKGDCPPDYDSIKWHKQMAKEGHLFQAMINEKLIGAAIMFLDETQQSLYIGRIFIDSIYHRKGYGTLLMNCIEKKYPAVTKYILDTPSWNKRTNAFYKKLGYSIIKIEEGFVFYEKINKTPI